MAGKFNPKDSGYVEVKDRITEFYAKFPDGSIQSEIVEFGTDVVIMKAYAYRDREDIRPGTGHSMMSIPGKTTFTEGSEVENAETSAVGRAIAALGFSVHIAVASADEIAMKVGAAAAVGDASTAPDKDKATPAQKRKLMAEARKVFADDVEIGRFVTEKAGVTTSADLKKGDISMLLDLIEEMKISATLDALDTPEEEE